MTDRTVLVRLRADVSDLVAKSQLARAAISGVNNEIDKSNDRTAWLAQGILALTPAVTRLGAGAVPVLSGMATQMMLTVAAAGTMAIAFNGVGDALGALNDYQLDPTAENLAQLNEAMAKIGPSGQRLVEYLDSIAPALAGIANSARGEMFPGIIDGLESIMGLAPRLSAVVGEIGGAIGQLAAEGGAGLSSERFSDFFDYLETRAKPLLIELGQTLGNFTLGLANMIVEFDPLTADFSSGLLEMSRSFAAWSESFGSSQGFQEFLDYVREAGPQALDFLGSLIMAFVELAEAAAPVGAVMLPVLTGMLNVLGDLANTPLGPIVIGFTALTSAWGRLNALAAITGSGVMGKATAGIRRHGDEVRKASRTVMDGFDGMLATYATAGARSERESERMAASAKKASGGIMGMGRAAAPVAGQIGLLGVAMTGVDDKLGLTNTTALALAGSLAGPWGAAVGAGAGLLLDMKAGADQATQGLKGLDSAIDTKNIEALTARIAEAKAEMVDQDKVTGFGDFFSDAMRDVGASGDASAMQTYRDAIAEAEAELAELKNARHDAFSDQSVYNNLMAETAALEENIAAMRAKRDEALRGANADLDYAESLLDVRDAANKYSNVLSRTGKLQEGQMRDGIEAKRALNDMAGAWNGLSDEAQNTPGALKRARDAFVAAAQEMGMGERAARRLARELMELPADVPVTIGVDHETAMAHARAVKAELASIDRNIDVYINVRRPNAGGMGPQIGAADGTTVPDSGRGYADRFLYMLADREEVISNRRGQADKFRPALKAINADMPPAVIKGMLADGGTAGRDGKGKKPPKRTIEFDSSTIKGVDELIEAQLAMAQIQTIAASDQALAAQAAVQAAEAQAEAAEDQLDAAEENKRTAESNLKAAEQLYEGLRDTVAGRFSNALTGGGLAGLQQNLGRDINAGRSMDTTLRALVAAGLDTTGARSGLYRELAASEDQETINELLAAGPEMIEQLEAQYAERDATNAARAAEVAERAYGPMVAEQQAAVAVAEAHRVVAEAQLSVLQGQVQSAETHYQGLSNQLGAMQENVQNLAGQLADALNSTVRGGRR